MASALRVRVSPSAYIFSNLTSISSSKKEKTPIAIVLISNGPGEITTWVRPIAEKLHQQLSIYPKNKESLISLNLVLVPCPNGTGKEHKVAEEWKQFDRIITAKNFWNLLLNPKRFGNWPEKGLVVFLGGDQFWSVLLSSRLNYKNMTYAEWITRWPQWNDRVIAMSSKAIDKVPKKYRSRCTVVGDLMGDLQVNLQEKDVLPEGKWIALMPGSKKAKLSIGVPFMIEVADRIKAKIPESKFLLPIAPTTTLEEIIELSGPTNPISKNYQSSIKYKEGHGDTYISKGKLITTMGTNIYIEEKQPAHLSLSQCNLAITTIGANTSELGALTVPMIVVIPTQHINAMKAWDGFLGIIARIPFISSFLNFLLSKWRLRKNNFLAWPNISAGRIVVPEKVGHISPKEIAEEAINWLNSPARLKGQKEDLRSLRGESGAVSKTIHEIMNLLKKM